MKIFEHISKQLVDVSVDNKNVKLYVCGPTVYNHVHIGNIRPIITFDVLNRLLQELGYNVKFVHNITDIDDKIIKKAKEENKSETEISEYYCAQYKKVLNVLNIYENNMMFPKVSDNIKKIEDYVNKILENGYAYSVDGDVYFRTSKINNYGEVSNKKISELEIGEKSSSNTKKENEKDFVLWKKTKEGLNWDTKFSIGRPGWHTECACLINAFFGEQADIHGGGVDLKFPHHENENAQNIAVSEKSISRIWMHVGHLNIDNEKMSKSLNNFILAKDLLENFDSNTVRWFFYQTSFTNPINFTYENIQNTQASITNILRTLNIFKSYLIIANALVDINFDKNKYLKSFEFDFNFPNFISLINEEIKKGNLLLRNKNYRELNEIFFNLTYVLKNILGIRIDNIHTDKDIENLKKWDQLKNDKQYELADEYRKKLIERNLI